MQCSGVEGVQNPPPPPPPLCVSSHTARTNSAQVVAFDYGHKGVPVCFCDFLLIVHNIFKCIRHITSGDLGQCCGRTVERRNMLVLGAGRKNLILHSCVAEQLI